MAMALTGQRTGSPPPRQTRRSSGFGGELGDQILMNFGVPGRREIHRIAVLGVLEVLYNDGSGYIALLNFNFSSSFARERREAPEVVESELRAHNCSYGCDGGIGRALESW